MSDFLVLYEEPRLLHTDQQTQYEKEGHALVVQAEDEVQAFVAAFDHLTRRGHMVRTMKAGEDLADLVRVEQERQQYEGDFRVLVVADLNLEQMQQVYQSGVPIIGGRGDTQVMTSIIRIQPYAISQ